MALGGVYTTGTVTINPDKITVVGVGTLWGPVAEVGDWLLVNGQVGIIMTVSDDTHLLLQSQWQGTLPAAAPYVLIKLSWLRYDPALTQAKLRELLADLDAQGTFLFTEIAPPDPALGQDGQWALKTDDQPWQLWHKEGGVWVAQPPPAGLDWKGTWNPATTYTVMDGVVHNGSSYVAKTVNTNKPPASNPADWDLFAAGGTTGATGPTGPPGMVWKGNWNSATAYVVNDGVQHVGASYIAVAPNTNSAPPSANWNLMAAAGSAAIADDAVLPQMLDADTAPKQILFRDRLNLFSRAGDLSTTTTSTPTLPFSFFGDSDGRSYNLFRSNHAGAHADQQIASFAIEGNPIGSGKNGPQSDDIALAIANRKLNWSSQPSIAQFGELDGLYINVRNGGPTATGSINASDSSCLAYAVQQWGTNTGYAVGIEGQTFVYDTTGTLNSRVGLQMGSYTPPAQGGPGMAGINIVVDAGTLSNGVIVTAVSPGTVNKVFQYVHSTLGERFSVDAAGAINLYGNQPELNFKAATSSTRNAVLYQQGNLFAIGAAGVASGFALDLGNFNVGLYGTTASTSPTTGALTVAGGLGVNGSLFAGGDLTITKANPSLNFMAAAASQQAMLNFYSAGVAKWQLGKQGDDSFILYSAASAKTVLAITGTSATCYVGLALAGSTQPVINFTPSSGSTKIAQIFQQGDVLNVASSGVAVWQQTNLANGAVGLTSTVASTSPTTGALTVAGGLGVNGSLYTGSNIISKGPMQINVASGAPSFYFSIADVIQSIITDNGNSIIVCSNAAATAGMYINHGASAWNALSDARLPYKKTARDITDALPSLDAFRLYENEVDGRLELFAKAQEVNAIFPHVVDAGSDDPDYTPTGFADPQAWGMSYDRLGVVALGYAREHQARLERIERQLGIA